MPQISQDRLKELLTYDPETGVFRWRARRGNQGGGVVAPGDEAGSMHRNGYWVICVENNRILAHRLAFLYMTGAFPPAEVDHINGDKVDNRWCNLRPATRSQNSANRPTKNRLGVKGVKARKNGRFEADIRVKGRKVYLGTFDTIAEAAAAYEKAANDVFGEFARVS